MRVDHPDDEDGGAERMSLNVRSSISQRLRERACRMPTVENRHSWTPVGLRAEIERYARDVARQSPSDSTTSDLSLPEHFTYMAL